MSKLIEATNQNGELRAVEVDKTSKFYGWVFYKHPDGQWVTLRQANAKELAMAESLATS
jgi:hypothetical protein